VPGKIRIFVILVAFLIPIAAGAQQAGSGARSELQQSLIQRYPLTTIGPSVLGLRGGEDTIRQVGGIVVVQRDGLQGAFDRRQMPVCLIREGKAEVSSSAAGQPISAGSRFYVISIYVGLDVVEFGLLSTNPVASGTGSARMWARAVFFLPPETLHNGDRPAVFQQIDKWVLPESAAPQTYSSQPAPAPPPVETRRVKLEPGMTPAQVVKELGEAHREVSFGSRVWLVYPGMVAYFENDSLKSVENNGRNARVRIRTEPEGAEIYMGEQLVGQGPTTLDLAPGRYVFLVRHAGFTPWRKEVDVLPGSDISLNAKLER
jgi:hypothetical protein